MIKTSKTYKVYEQGHGSSNLGTVRASFSTADHGDAAEGMANGEADRLADENPGVRFYTLVMTRGVYRPQPAHLIIRNYASA